MKFAETKNNKVCVLINDEFFGWLKQKSIEKLKIKNETRLCAEQLHGLQKILENDCCKPKALQILARRDHSRKELIHKLEKIANLKTTEKVVETLQKIGLVNDAKYAENLTKNMILKKCYGEKKVLYELKLKGIDSETASNTFKKININPLEPIIKLIKKKYINKLNEFKSRQQVVRALLQKGHSYGLILDAIQVLTDELK